MRQQASRQVIAAIGTLCVLVATFLAWGTVSSPPDHPGALRRIYTYEPTLPSQDAWHAFPVIAALVVVAALLASAVHVFPLGPNRARTILGVSEAAFALVLTLAVWVSPRAGQPGPGQPLSTAGGALLLLAAALMLERAEP